MLSTGGWQYAAVASDGPVYGPLDGAWFIRQWADSGATWKFGFGSGEAEVEVHDEDDSVPPVLVNGEPTGSNLVPRPWGLLMSFTDANAHLVDAVAATLVREPQADGLEHIRFDTPKVAVRMVVDPTGWVLRKEVTEPGSDEVIDRIELRNVAGGLSQR